MSDKKYGVLITPGFRVEPVELDETLESYQTAIGGYIESVLSKLPGLLLLVDEEGKLKGKTVNICATALCNAFPRDILVGDALLVRDGEEDFEGMSLDDAEFLTQLIRSRFSRCG